MGITLVIVGLGILIALGTFAVACLTVLGLARLGFEIVESAEERAAIGDQWREK